MDNIIWKDVFGWEGYYQASYCGKVKSLRRESPGKNGSVRILNEKIIRPQTSPGNYRKLWVYRDGIRKMVTVQHLVMLAFEGPMPKGCECIMHLDDNPSNNRFDNLKYATFRENVRDAINKNRFNLPKGKPRVPVIAIDTVTGEEMFFPRIKDASEKLNVSAGSIGAIVNGIYKSKGRYNFKRA